VALKPHRHWYLEKALQTNCYWLLTASPSECQFQAYNLKGQLIDEIKIPSQTSTQQD